MRGIRGATTILQDKPEEIINKTRELLLKIQEANPDLSKEEICSIFFTVTNDICSEFPAKAAREIGWDQVPLMCGLEIPVSGSLPKCIRILIHWNTKKDQENIQHIYLHKAKSLRPDLSRIKAKSNQEKQS